MPITTPPTFSPPKFAIPLGAAGTVLTSNGVNAAPTFQVSGAGTIGAKRTYVALGGVENNVDPGGGWPTGYGRLFVDTTAGNAEFTGLKAGTDGQQVLIIVTGGNQLQLDNQNVGSLAANFFVSNGNLIIISGGRTLAVYTTGTGWSVG